MAIASSTPANDARASSGRRLSTSSSSRGGLTCVISRVTSTPVRADRRQWIIRGLSPGWYSLRPYSSSAPPRRGRRVLPVVSAGWHRASTRGSTRPTAGYTTSVSTACPPTSPHHRCPTTAPPPSAAAPPSGASAGVRSTARLTNPNGKLVLSWNRRRAYTPRRLGRSDTGTSAAIPAAAWSRYAWGWRVNASHPSSSAKVRLIVGQNRFRFSRRYPTVTVSPTVAASGRRRVTRTRLSVTRLIDTLTSRMPIISPNTPNSSDACVFTAATPMNTISRA